MLITDFSSDPSQFLLLSSKCNGVISSYWSYEYKLNGRRFGAYF
jgi:hypothetical protein